MTWLLRLLLLAFVIAGGACGQGCDAVLKAGIAVTIVDGATGNPFQGDVTVIATEGSYLETAIPPAADPRTAFLAHERPGTYRVEVQASGYIPWVATDVRVTRDDCHVQTVDLTAQLERAGAG